MYKMMSAGPTNVRENVMRKRSEPFGNPDLDQDVIAFYRETCELFSKAVHTTNPCFILGGEGILGLEAACASLTEPGDRVLVIDNGIYGAGFKEFVQLYGGDPVVYHSNYKKSVDAFELRKFLEKDHRFKYATFVHCDTPSGVLNDVMAIGEVLHEYGILSIVDSVAGLFGEPMNMDACKIDILCGGSQKALSAPPGLAMVWVSPEAFKAMERRQSPIAGYYTNLLRFKEALESGVPLYTLPISDIMALRVALDNFFADGSVFERHRNVAYAVREALKDGGLSLYLSSGWANTVTAIEVPKGIKADDILETMYREHGIMISGSYGCLSGKVIRIGHMGENTNEVCLIETLEALEKTLNKFGFECQNDLALSFRATLDRF